MSLSRVVLAPLERKELERRARSRALAVELVKRAKVILMLALPLRHPGKKGSSAGPHNAIVSIAQTPESFVKLSVLLMAKCRMIVERHSYNRHTRGDHRSQYWEIIFNLSPKATSLHFVVLGLRLLVIDLLLGKLLLG